MARITIALSDRTHLALKLLSLQKEKRVIKIIQEAIEQHLKNEGAYDLGIHSKKDDEVQPDTTSP
jgi:predicted DNA-binding protein